VRGNNFFSQAISDTLRVTRVSQFSMLILSSALLPPRGVNTHAKVDRKLQRVASLAGCYWELRCCTQP